MTSFEEVAVELRKYKDPERAKFVSRYFKTGKGEYAEGDVFLGLTVPQQRKIAKKYRDLPLRAVQKLLHSPIHEFRLTALLILAAQYVKADEKQQEKIVKLYLRSTKYINNWDLVDTSAPYILGSYFLTRDRKVLYRLCRSSNVWERRIAILTTQRFIKEDEYKDTFALAKLLLTDTHDLIHKAVGWMLREVGNKDVAQEKKFLDTYAAQMPRTMLRYAIEKFDEYERKRYLSLK